MYRAVWFKKDGKLKKMDKLVAKEQLNRRKKIRGLAKEFEYKRFHKGIPLK